MHGVRALVVCGQHGRELITTEVCNALERPPEGLGLWVVPLANPRGRAKVLEGDACWRGNERGVDLNRNFEPWEPLRGEEYSGGRPFSEIETQEMVAILEYVKPHILINVHSGARGVVVPFDGGGIPPLYGQMVYLARKAGTVPVLSGTVFGRAAGTLVDYALQRQGVQLAYTLEIYGPSVGVAREDCHAQFNPPEEEKAQVTLHWTRYISQLFSEILQLVDHEQD